METFPIVKRKDIAAHGTYRTKDKILEIYDAMTAAKSARHRVPDRTNRAPRPGPPPRVRMKPRDQLRKSDDHTVLR